MWLNRNVDAIRIGFTYAKKRLTNCCPKHKWGGTNNQYKYKPLIFLNPLTHVFRLLTFVSFIILLIFTYLLGLSYWVITWSLINFVSLTQLRISWLWLLVAYCNPHCYFLTYKYTSVLIMLVHTVCYPILLIIMISVTFRIFI